MDGATTDSIILNPTDVLAHIREVNNHPWTILRTASGFGLSILLTFSLKHARAQRPHVVLFRRLRKIIFYTYKTVVYHQAAESPPTAFKGIPVLTLFVNSKPFFYLFERS